MIGILLAGQKRLRVRVLMGWTVSGGGGGRCMGAVRKKFSKVTLHRDFYIVSTQFQKNAIEEKETYYKGKRTQYREFCTSRTNSY
jgi:hypothetical protein